MNELNVNLKRLRIEKNLTQQEVADKLFVTRQCVSRWEQGKSIPDIYNLESLAKLYGVTINDLLDEDATKMMLVDSALKSKKRDKLNYIGIFIGFIAILLSIGIFIYFNENKKVEDIIYTDYQGEILSIEDYVAIIKSHDKEYTLDLVQLICTIYDNKEDIISRDDLKVGDYLNIIYVGEDPTSNINRIDVIDSKIEKSINGIFLDAKGADYKTEDDLPSSKERVNSRFMIMDLDFIFIMGIV